MPLLKTEIINKIIDKNFTYNFEVADEGIYLIEIIARANSRWQNLKQLKSIFRRDVLTVEIDGLKFPALQKKSAFFDGEMVWNGNQLKGLAKTEIFVIYLGKGQHNLLFLNKVKPTLENITITKAENEQQIDCLPSTNNPPESGDGRPWLSYAFVNLAVKELNISAKADKKSRDDEDIKLIIDGKIEKNDNKKSHRDWLWCGKILKGKTEEITKVLNFDGKSIHVVELWADLPRRSANAKAGLPRRSPELVGMKAGLSPCLKKIEIKLSGIKAPKKENVEKKRIPTVDDPEWTGDFRDDPVQIILARIIFGEVRSLPEKGRIAVGWSIKNRVIDPRWGDNYYGVILQPKQYSCLNENDENLPLVRNPAKDTTQIKDWYECYEVAGKVIKGEVGDPTGGANHYFSTSIDYPYWTKTKEAHFKLKIINTLFYDVKKAGSGGFIKIFFIISVLFLVLIFGGAYMAASSLFDSKIVKSVNQDLENEWKLSPLGTKTGYFVYLNNQQGAIDYDNYTALEIADRDGKNKKEIYRGNYHTSYWEWLNEGEVVVYYGCGTECMVGFVIDTGTGQKKEELQYGVDYTWSPNKEYVFAYNYTWRYGLTVGDKKKNILLSLERDSNSDTTDNWDLIVQTQAVWSPDSTKLAVVIKKEGQQKMELLIYEEKEEGFKQIFQKDIEDYSENDGLVWNDESLWYGKFRL